MTTAIRQRKLFAAEDYRVIYRAFSEINFAAYDFDTIRSAMVEYIRLNFSEDFNDWIESSEFVALIELLAYLGQSLSFRMDLNTRENFIDSAERRDSILKLARLIGYNPRRRLPAVGLLKITDISANQDILDSNGNNLNNIQITWNDPLNPDWLEQFTLVMNSVFSSTTPFGTPYKKGTVGGIRTELYQMNNDASANRTFPFNALVNNESVDFEIVNPDFTTNETFFERAPDPLTPRYIIYRNDGQGNDSANTGFFLMFKQGSLSTEDFQIDVPRENRILDVDGTQINETDVWVQEIDSDGFVIDQWEKVPNLVGTNVIFNNIENSQRNIYSVIPELDDGIRIRFADGRFGNVPAGIFRVWYRQSNGSSIQIRPDDIRNVRLDIPYQGKTDNRLYFVNMAMSLQQSVINSAPAQTNDQIRESAPQVYYTQDRMVNGQDYNVYPLRNQQAAKIKAVNRIFSGFSRYVDINDPTGLSQNINVIGEDGMLYLEENRNSTEVALPTSFTDEDIRNNFIQPLLETADRKHFFYYYYPRKTPTTGLEMVSRMQTRENIPNLQNAGTITISIENHNTKYEVSFDGTEDYDQIIEKIDNQIFQSTVPAPWDPTVLQLTEYTGKNQFKFESSLGSISIDDNRNGLLLRILGFSPNPAPYEQNRMTWNNETSDINSSTGFLSTESIGGQKTTTNLNIMHPTWDTAAQSEWYIKPNSLLIFRNAGTVMVINVDSSNNITLAENVLDGDVLEQIILPYRANLDSSEQTMVDQCLSDKTNFGLRYNDNTLQWEAIRGDALASENIPFDLGTKTEPKTAMPPMSAIPNTDTSWLLRAEYSASQWRFTVRGLDYIFESDKQVRFYHADSSRITDPDTGLPIIDFIKVFKANGLDQDYSWNLEGVFVEDDGWVDPRRVKVTFTDSDNDGIPDDPLIFEKITGILPDDDPLNDRDQQTSELIFRAYTNSDGYQEFELFTDTRWVFNTTPAGMIYNSTQKSLTGTPTDPTLEFQEDDVIYIRNVDQFFRRTSINTWENVSALYRYARGTADYMFQWKHFSPPDQRIDPAISNIVDIYVLTTAYDTELRRWIDNNGTQAEQPQPPTTEDLRLLFTEELENKMISDEVIFHPVRYKVLFGTQAESALRATFKVTKIPGTEVSDGEIKSRVIAAINRYFAINNWDFGETFFYTELSAFIHQSLATIISSIVLVPIDDESRFGKLFQIRSEPNEVFISSAKVTDVQVVSALTNNNLRIGR